MGLAIPISQEVLYATQGNIGFPGTAGQLTAAQTMGASDLDAHIDDQTGSGITISSITIVPAR